MTPYEYYTYHFPFEALAQLATAGNNDPLCHREFATEGDYYKRYIEAKSAASLRAMILEMKSLRSIHIGAVFSNGPSLARKGLSVPTRRELIIDLDLTDYEFLDLKTRDGEGNEIVDLEACDAAWPFAAIGIFLLRWMLREQFGYERVLVVYSGRRGAHLWVLDERAMRSSDEVRASVASFVNLGLTKDQKRATPQMLKFVDTYELWDVVEHAFLELIVDSDYLDNFANLDEFVERLGLNHDAFRNMADDASVRDSTSGMWTYIHEKVHDTAKRTGQAWIVDRLRETMLAYVWPRIDFNVTKAVNHLIKCPYVAHPKTGRIAVPIDPDDYWRFDPRTAPTLGDLGKDWAKRADVLRWVAHDPPRLPDPGRGKPRRVRRGPAQSPVRPTGTTETTGTMDIEELAGPSSVTAPAPAPSPALGIPVPRRTGYTRKISPLAVAAAPPENARAHEPMATSDSD